MYHMKYTTLEILRSFKVYLLSTGINEPFLLDDSGPDEKHILIFGRNCGLEVT